MSQAAPQQQQKAKPKKLRMRAELYDLTGTAAKLRNRKCPRCGSVMAHHAAGQARWVCGSCSFTDYPAK